jgi:ketosteroid isomerase-like protein
VADEETAFCGAALHDLGLVPPYRRDNRFEVDGADAAREFCSKHQVPPERTDPIWEAIALHPSAGIATRLEAEIALVHLGAGLELFGLTPTRGQLMKSELKDLKSIAQQFFAAYDAHDVEGMVACCADDAKAWYAPYGRDSVMLVRGGIDAVWRAFQTIPDLRVKVSEMILAEGNTVVAQAWIGGPFPVDVPGIVKKDQVVSIPHLFVLRVAPNRKISRLDCYFDNTVLGSIKATAF